MKPQVKQTREFNEMDRSGLTESVSGSHSASARRCVGPTPYLPSPNLNSRQATTRCGVDKTSRTLCLSVAREVKDVGARTRLEYEAAERTRNATV